ncbi:MAG: glycosyltransferase family 2 protein [Promethearchaeota archaeon]
MNAIVKSFNRVFSEKKREIAILSKDNTFIDKDILISIIIPLYNEEHSIIKVLNRIPNHHRYEIIIVDDGSTDNSVNKIKKINDKNIKIIKHYENRGYGAALKTGITHANGDIIVTMDSDGQHDPQDIHQLIKPIINNQADLCIGSRYLGKSDYKVPVYTRIGELFIKVILWTLFNQKVGNNQNGFRAFKKELIDTFISIKNIGMGFTTELLFEFAFQGFRITEIPINLQKRAHGRSNVNLVMIFRSLFSCIFIYLLKKIQINNRIIKTIEKVIY